MWRFAGASAIGTSHVSLGNDCQDSHSIASIQDCAGNEVLVSAVADGAGSASRSGEGAQLAVDSFVSEVAAVLGRKSVLDLCAEDIRALASCVRKSIVAHAETARAPLREFACTFLGAIVGPQCAAFFQIGDGAIIYADPEAPDEWSWVFWPQRGEYANATSFLTDDDAIEAAEVSVHNTFIEEVALFSDGIEKLVLHYETRSVHFPFFAAMFPPIRRSADFGKDLALSEALANYLASPTVNQKTDDDKTLVLATRRVA